MNIPPPTGDFFVHFGKSVLDWHLILPNQATGNRRSHQLGKPAATGGNGVVVEVVFRVMAHGRVPVSDKDVGSGPFFKHVSKIF